ncbi:MAG: hypothetical protein QXT64_03705 [Desulfurococcaceae archaeon]
MWVLRAIVVLLQLEQYCISKTVFEVQLFYNSILSFDNYNVHCSTH